MTARPLVAGFGFRSIATEASLSDALAATGGQPSLIATAADKAAHPAFRALADRLAVPVSAVEARDLPADTPTASTASRAARGTGSLAEASALAAAGPGARLVARRCISADRLATCALAEAAPAPEGSKP